MIKNVLNETSTQTPLWDCEQIEGNPSKSENCTATIDNNLLNLMFTTVDREINTLKLSVDELQDQLSPNKIRQEQKGDELCLSIQKKLESNENPNEDFYNYKDILYKIGLHNNKEHLGRKVVPEILRPTRLALYHWRGHPGGNRLYYDIKDTVARD